MLIGKKPACQDQIMRHFRASEIDIEKASQVVVIGDRLFTDVLLAKNLGCHSIWLRRGAVPDYGLLTRLEGLVYSYIKKI